MAYANGSEVEQHLPGHQLCQQPGGGRCSRSEVSQLSPSVTFKVVFPSVLLVAEGITELEKRRDDALEQIFAGCSRERFSLKATRHLLFRVQGSLKEDVQSCKIAEVWYLAGLQVLKAYKELFFDFFLMYSL